MARADGRYEAFPDMYAPDRFKAPTGELGYLTPIRHIACDRTLWIWKCRCGADVTRTTKVVRKAVAAGRTPKCSPKCQGRAAA